MPRKKRDIVIDRETEVFDFGKLYKQAKDPLMEVKVRKIVLEGITNKKKKFILFLCEYSGNSGFYLRIYSNRGKFQKEYLFAIEVEFKTILQFLQ